MVKSCGAESIPAVEMRLPEASLLLLSLRFAQRHERSCPWMLFMDFQCSPDCNKLIEDINANDWHFRAVVSGLSPPWATVQKKSYPYTVIKSLYTKVGKIACQGHIGYSNVQRLPDPKHIADIP